MSFNKQGLSNMLSMTVLVQFVAIFIVTLHGEGHAFRHRIHRRDVQTDSNRINTIREQLLKYAVNNPGAIHDRDILNIKTKDWLINRYIKHYNNDFKAENALIESFRFFKTERLHDINDSYIPSEFWGSGCIQLAGKGVNNEPVVNVMWRCCHQTLACGPEFTKIHLTYDYYHAFKLLNADDDKHMLLGLHYLSNAAPHNFDLEFLKIYAKAFTKHFSLAPFMFIIVEASESSESFMRAVLNMLNIKNVRFIKEKEMSKYLSLDSIPARVGGTNRALSRMPPGARSGKCLPHTKHIPGPEWDQFRQLTMTCIREGMAVSGQTSLDQYLNSC